MRATRTRRNMRPSDRPVEDCHLTRRFPLHVHLSTLFLTTDPAGRRRHRLAGLPGQPRNPRFDRGRPRTRIEADLDADFLALIRPAELAAQVLSVTSLVEEQSLEGRLAHLPLLRELLNASPALTSLYVGYDSGDFFMVRRLWNDDDRHFFKAPEQRPSSSRASKTRRAARAVASSSSTRTWHRCAATTTPTTRPVSTRARVPGMARRWRRPARSRRPPMSSIPPARSASPSPAGAAMAPPSPAPTSGWKPSMPRWRARR